MLADDFDRLNDEQKAIVKGFKGPTMIVAGPGTGKTRTVAVLIGRLLAEGTKLKEILALTFSEKAARELRGRVMEYHPKSYDECWISTFHSFCARVLREQYHRVGIHPEFRLLTGFKEALLMSGICSKLTPETFPVFGRVLTKRGFQLEVLTFISLLKSNLVTPDGLQTALDTEGLDSRSRHRLGELLLLYRRYEDERRRTGFLDFRDLISFTIDVLRDPAAAARYRSQFRVVLVDEFQDTDPAQYLLLRLLKGGGAEQAPRIAVIGDPRQSIYRFRGADPGMMGAKSAFRREFKARLFPLRSNYRSSECILTLAGKLRWSQSFTPESPGKGAAEPPADALIARSAREGFVELLEARDELEEARLVARRIAALLTYGAHRCFAPSEIAVLVRNNYQIDLISESLRALHVPFDIAGDMKFFRSEEVTALASLLQATAGPTDKQEQPLRRSFASPIFGLDQIWVQQFLASMPPGRGLEQDLDELLAKPQDEQFGEGLTAPAPETFARLAAFREMLRLLRDGIGLPLVSLFARLLLTVPHLLADPAAPGARHVMRFRNMIDDFCDVWEKQHGRPATAADLMPNFDEWLTYYASTLEQEDDEGTGAATAPRGVRLMTVHQSKGLEFPAVFVTGLCEGQFPVRLRESLLLGSRGLAGLQHAIDAGKREIRFFNPYPADHEDHLEEERRLLYVALTRAEEALILTLPRRIGTDPALPAPFLSELGLKPTRDWHEQRALTIGELRTRLARLDQTAREELRPDLERLAASAEHSGDSQEDPLAPRHFGIAAPTQAELAAGFRFSAQSLRDYIDCPRRFFFKHVLRLRDTRTENQSHFIFGNAVHTCLEHIHKPTGDFAAGRTPSSSDLDAIWEVHGRPVLQQLPVLHRILYDQQARELLERYREAVYVNGQIPAIGTLGVEADLTFEFRGHKCKGRIDRWLKDPDGTLWIIDYKTGASKSGASIAKEAFPDSGPPSEVQLPFYLLAAQCLGYPRACVTTLYPKEPLYKRKYQNYKPGYMKAGMLGLGAGPDWAVQIEPDRFRQFEDTIDGLMHEILSRRIFDCRPSAAPGANSCINLSKNKGCEFRAFCQERLDQLRVPAREYDGQSHGEPD